MSFKVQLYWDFKKKINSTLQPTLTSSTPVYDVEIKGSCSIQNPVLVFNFDVLPPEGNSLAGNKAAYNYCYIEDFYRYYFINEWVYDSGLWIAYCTVDVLATYKRDIQGFNCYVLRSSNRYDGTIPDTMYPTLSTGDGILDYSTEGHVWGTDQSNPVDGAYIVGILNGANDGVAAQNALGACTYYLMNAVNFRSFMYSLFTSPTYLNIASSDLSEGLQRALFNPIQYIASIMYFPIENFQPAGLEESSYIQIGWYKINIRGTVGVLTHTGWTAVENDFTLKKHPQSAERGVWLNSSPYTQYTLEFWPFGTLPIDGAKLVNASKLNCSILVDLISGSAILRCTTDEGDSVVLAAEGQLGIPVQISQLSLDYGSLKSPSSLIPTAAATVANEIANPDKIMNVLSGAWNKALNWWDSKFGTNLSKLNNNFEAPTSSETGIKIKDTASAIGNAIQGSMGQTSVTGSQGGFAGMTLLPRVSYFFTLMADDDLAHNGRPLCKNVTLGSIPGFIKVQDADIAIAGTENEQEAVRDFLEAGFYLE